MKMTMFQVLFIVAAVAAAVSGYDMDTALTANEEEGQALLARMSVYEKNGMIGAIQNSISTEFVSRFWWISLAASSDS